MGSPYSAVWGRRSHTQPPLVAEGNATWHPQKPLVPVSVSLFAPVAPWVLFVPHLCVNRWFAPVALWVSISHSGLGASLLHPVAGHGALCPMAPTPFPTP